jgi:hypothetical protein
MRLYRCTKFTKDCYPCDHRYRHSYKHGDCNVACPHDKEASCQECDGANMYINEKRDMHLADMREEEYLDRMGKSIDDIAEILKQQDSSTWEGFGALLAWAKEQDWWTDFLQENGMVLEKKEEDDVSTTTEIFEYFPMNLLDPDEFADAIVAFVDDLEEQKEKEEQTPAQEEPKDMVICNGTHLPGCRKDVGLAGRKDANGGCEHYHLHEPHPQKCALRYCAFIRKTVTCPLSQPGEEPTTTAPATSGGDVWST